MGFLMTVFGKKNIVKVLYYNILLKLYYITINI